MTHLLFEASRSHTFKAPDKEPAHTIISLGSKQTHSTDVACPFML